MSHKAQSEAFYDKRGLRQARSLPEIHKWRREILISSPDLCISSGKIGISLADLSIFPKETPISSREIPISFFPSSQGASAL